MEGNNVFFRSIMLFYFRKGKNAAKTRKKICAVYGENAVSERMCQKWFSKFRSNDKVSEEPIDLDDAPRSGRPITTDIDQLMSIINSEPHATTREIAARLNIGQSTVSENLSKLKMIKMLDVWVPKNLTESSLLDRISICDSLNKRNKDYPFLKRMITCHHKWIICSNTDRKRAWGKRDETDEGLAPNKFMLCVWWNWQGIVFYELLPSNQTINSDKYCLQLDNLKAAIDAKCTANEEGSIIYHHDTSKPHINLQTHRKLLDFNWEILPHPPYSPDLAPSDYHLFQALDISLTRLTFASLDSLKNYLDGLFKGKSINFFEAGIMKLPERWQKVIDNNGAYLID